MDLIEGGGLYSESNGSERVRGKKRCVGINKTFAVPESCIVECSELLEQTDGSGKCVRSRKISEKSWQCR